MNTTFKPIYYSPSLGDIDRETFENMKAQETFRSMSVMFGTICSYCYEPKEMVIQKISDEVSYSFYSQGPCDSCKGGSNL